MNFSSGLLADLLQLLDGRAGEHVHRHVAALAEGRLELFQHQEDFAVIGAGVVLRLDIDRASLAGIGAAVQIAARHHMRVVEAEARRPWHKGDAAHAMRGDEGTAFLRSAVRIDRDYQAVRVQQFRRIGVVVNIDNGALSFIEAQKRPWKLPVVEGCRDDMVRRQLDEPLGDAERVVRLFAVSGPAAQSARGAAPMSEAAPAALSRVRRSMVTASILPVL